MGDSLHRNMQLIIRTALSLPGPALEDVEVASMERFTRLPVPSQVDYLLSASCASSPHPASARETCHLSAGPTSAQC